MTQGKVEPCPAVLVEIFWRFCVYTKISALPSIGALFEEPIEIDPPPALQQRKEQPLLLAIGPSFTMIIPTPTYIAPEIAKGRSYGKRVDIYSLGILLYKLLNHGRYPFMPPAPQPIRFEDTDKSLEKRLGGEPLPLPAEGSETLKAAIIKACEYRPADRFDSAEEFYKALQLAAETTWRFNPSTGVNWKDGNATDDFTTNDDDFSPILYDEPRPRGLLKKTLIICAAIVFFIAIVGVVTLVIVINKNITITALDTATTPTLEPPLSAVNPATIEQTTDDLPVPAHEPVHSITESSTFSHTASPTPTSTPTPTPTPRISNLGVVKQGLQSGKVMLRDGFSTAAKSVDSLSAGTQVSIIRKIMWRENGKVVQKFYEVKVARSSERGYVLCSGIDTEYDDEVPHKYVDGTPPTPTPKPSPTLKPIVTQTPYSEGGFSIPIAVSPETPLTPHPGFNPDGTVGESILVVITPEVPLE